MTAFDLIDSIFSRVQTGVAGHQRRISPEQLEYLKSLIGQDPEGAAFKPNGPGEWIWAPSGRNKYLLTDGTYGKKRMLTRMSSINATAMGRLF